MKIRSLNHIGLTVSNFEKTVKWYYEMFGFKLITENTLEKELVNKLYYLYGVHNSQIRLGFLRAPKGGIIEIFEFSPSISKEKVVWNRPGPTHFTMDVKDINRWYNYLKMKGVCFLSKPQCTEGVNWVFLEDPDGNLIELVDLKMNYITNRLFGGFFGKILARNKFKKYYSDDEQHKFTGI